MSDESLRVNRYDGIDAVDQAEWDSIVSSNDLLNSYAYQRAVEKSGINGFRYRYFTFRRGDRLIAHVSVGVFTFGLDVMLQDPLKGILASVKKIFPSFLRLTLIECGHPTAIGTTFCVPDMEELPGIVALTDAEMTKLAREEGTSFLAVRDLAAADEPRYLSLLRNGFRVTPNMADTILELGQGSFEEYLDDLVAKRRREIRQRLKVFHREGCTIETITDFASIAVELESLWTQTYRHATEYQREILNADYFRFMSDFLGERSFILLCRKGGVPIGFTMLLDSGDTLISTYCGMDYAFSRATFTYFVLFYKSIEEAIRRGKTRLELGITNYNPKIEIGALPVPISIYAKSLSPIGNLFFAPILRLMASSPRFGMRKIFNERHYDRHPLRETVEVRLDGLPFKITDVSIGGLGVEGKGRPVRRRYKLRVAVMEGYSVRMSVVARSVAESGGLHRVGFQIRKMPWEYVPLWHDFVQRFATGGQSAEGT